MTESTAEERLERLWETPPTWYGRISTVDHKIIGLRYFATALIFLLLGGVEALAMRAQLSHANARIVGAETYAQLFTLHGVTMIFLFALPVLSGFANYLWPLVLGARDMALPRMNALGYWLFAGAGVFVYSSIPAWSRAGCGVVQLCPAGLGKVSATVRNRLLRTRPHPARHLDDRGRDQLHRHLCAHASAGHVADACPDRG